MKITILTPEGPLFEGETDYIKVPGAMGPMEILNNHAPIVTSLAEGKLTFSKGKKSDDRESYQVSGGFFEFSSNEGVLLADSATKVS